MKSVITQYNDAIKTLFNKGYKTDSTLALYNQTLSFNLSPLNDKLKKDYSIIMPKQRGQKQSSVKYAIAEAIWYRKATQEIDLIVPFGQIWSKMTDENDHVNSNYGYQLLKNNDLKSIIKEFKSVIDSNQPIIIKDLYIASSENQHSTSDLVCNNKLQLTLYRKHQQYYLDCRIVARSIDIMYGLPYDMFAAQGFMTYVAHQLNKHIGYKSMILLDTLSFEIVNLHWYLSQNPSQDDIDCLSNEVIVVSNSFNLPFCMSQSQINNFKSEIDIRTYRDNITNNYSSIKSIDCEEIVNYNELFEYHGNLNDIREFVVNYAILNKTYDENFDCRLTDVIEVLTKNRYDRKTLIVDNKRNLYYISFVNNEFILSIEKGDS